MISIRSEGCSSFRKTASVMLMMPAPTRTTSTSESALLSVMVLFSGGNCSRARDEPRSAAGLDRRSGKFTAGRSTGWA